MEKFSLDLQVRWSDIDANRHLRHSVYYDYGALCRMEALGREGLTTHKLEQLAIGPVLFREEAVFRREILFDDKIRITMEVLKATPDYSRWSFRHQILKHDDTVAATIQVDGAWIDLHKRKLTVPDAFLQEVFSRLTRSQEFELIEKK